MLIRRWTKSCTLTQSFISGLTGLFSSSTEFPFFLQLGVTSHYNSVVNMKPLTHYSMLLYKQLPRETGQVSSGEGGRGVFLIFALPYRYVPPQRVWFLHRFGLKTDIDFAYFSLNSNMVSGGTTGVYKRVCLFSSK